VRTLRIKGMRASAGQSIGSCGATACGGTVSDRLVNLDARINGTSKVKAVVKLPADGSAPQILQWTVQE
jgi:hypothetical protein